MSSKRALIRKNHLLFYPRLLRVNSFTKTFQMLKKKNLSSKIVFSFKNTNPTN